MTFFINPSSQQSPEALQSNSNIQLYVAEGRQVKNISIQNVAPTHVLCLINAKIQPDNWERVLGFFHSQIMHAIVNVFNAPVEEVRNALYTAVMEQQHVHHYHGDNGLYALWDTLDGRTAVMVVTDPSETFLPLQIAGHALGIFNEWEHKMSSLWGVDFENIGSNVPVAFRDLFDNILAHHTQTVLAQAISVPNTSAKVKKI